MKKLILSTLAVLAAMGLHAQLLKVESMERVRPRRAGNTQPRR